MLRKWLNVEKRSFFSYGHVNDKHKKMDWTVRIIGIALLFIGFFINNFIRDPYDPIWFWETYIVLFVIIIATEIVRIIMEKRYAENRNAYILSTIQLVIGAILLITVLMTNFFGLF